MKRSAKKYSVAKPTNLKRIPVPVPGKSSSAMSSPCLMLWTLWSPSLWLRYKPGAIWSFLQSSALMPYPGLLQSSALNGWLINWTWWVRSSSLSSEPGKRKPLIQRKSSLATWLSYLLETKFRVMPSFKRELLKPTKPCWREKVTWFSRKREMNFYPVAS